MDGLRNRILNTLLCDFCNALIINNVQFQNECPVLKQKFQALEF